MTLSLTFACLWVLAAAIVAFLPMRLQYAPGFVLLFAAPAILYGLAVQHNVWIVLIALGAAVSMFRRPLLYFARRALGLPVSRPTDPGEGGG